MSKESLQRLISHATGEGALLSVLHKTTQEVLFRYPESLVGADLEGVSLAGADLSGVDLRRSTLRGADLSGADLSTASLFMANLSGANLAGACLRGAVLSAACLVRADLTGADLTDATIIETIGNNEQILTIQTGVAVVVLTAHSIAIGYEMFTPKDLAANDCDFLARTIGPTHGAFWAKWRDQIVSLHHNHFAKDTSQ